MKSFVYIILVLLLACSKKEDPAPLEDPKIKIEKELLNIGDTAYFYGNVLHDLYFFKETSIRFGAYLTHNQKYYVKTDTLLVYQTSLQKYQGSLYPVTTEESEIIRTELYRPKGIQNVTTFKEFFNLGQKKLANGTWPIVEPCFGFNFTHERKNTFYKTYDTYGDQTGSSLEIIEKKEVLTEEGYLIIVKFNIKCKLYEYQPTLKSKKYVGNLEAIHQTSFLYKPIIF